MCFLQTVTCCHNYQSSSQTCTWVESPGVLPQTPAESVLSSSSWSAEDTTRTFHFHDITNIIITLFWFTLPAIIQVSVSNLVFAPQQAVGLIVNTGADKVHAVILNPEVEISEPEHQPASGQEQEI